MSKQFLARLPRLTISLRRFLIVVGLAGPVSAVLYNSYVRPYYGRSSFDALRTRLDHSGMIADVVWRQSRWSSRSDLAFVLVRPGENGVIAGPWYDRPRSRGISICGDAIFINGARFYPQQPRCFLVFDPVSKSF